MTDDQKRYLRKFVYEATGVPTNMVYDTSPAPQIFRPPVVVARRPLGRAVFTWTNSRGESLPCCGVVSATVSG